MITYKDIKNNSEINTYIEKADQSLDAIGYTEHSFTHAKRVAGTAKMILEELGYPQREAELAQIAGYMHDIGNLINRIEHAQSGAIMAFRILRAMGMEPDETATVVTAIGNHDESTAMPVNPVAAALIIADKSDVRRSRVRNRDTISFDIHDRVNYSVKSSKVVVDRENGRIELHLVADTKRFSAMEFYEIFLERMLLCRRAAEHLKVKFVTYLDDQILA
ncbi:MAG: HD domain-containing protein [Ruminococcaceae bacterium]|nr:HD domain-containing protein [Oscillospiraceae bacterium]